jgi:hypothetical protein
MLFYDIQASPLNLFIVENGSKVFRIQLSNIEESFHFGSNAIDVLLFMHHAKQGIDQLGKIFMPYGILNQQIDQFTDRIFDLDVVGEGLAYR